MNESALSVLLIDDDPDACAIFKLVMDHHQMPLQVANNAHAALDYLQTNHPDVVVIDIFLPDTDGYQTLNQIRKKVPVSACRFVATTAYYTNDTPQEVLSGGFDGYIPKPFDATKLVPYLQSIVSQGQS